VRHRRGKGAAKVRQRCGKGAAKVRHRRGKGAAKVRQKCGKSAAKVRQRCGKCAAKARRWLRTSMSSLSSARNRDFLGPPILHVCSNNCGLLPRPGRACFCGPKCVLLEHPASVVHRVACAVGAFHWVYGCCSSAPWGFPKPPGLHLSSARHLPHRLQHPCRRYSRVSDIACAHCSVLVCLGSARLAHARSLSCPGPALQDAAGHSNAEQVGLGIE